MKFLILLIGLAVPLSSCGSAHRGLKPNDTQVVAQWSLSVGPPAQRGSSGFGGAIGAANRCLQFERRIEQESGGLYFEDGNDIGSGTCNVYLYTDQIDETVARLVSMARSGRLPSDLRIGVAVYKDAARTDWTYRVAYPPTLTRFDLSGGG